MDGQSKKSFWKFAGVFMALVLVVFGGLVVWKVYEVRRGREQIDKLAEKLKELERLDYEKAMADTYGGKTPQETLRLYIEAVEKGDYELASRYFIEEKREKEKQRLETASPENVNKFLNKIRSISYESGRYSFDKKEFIIYEPTYIKFLLYPNNVWKILEL